MIRGEIRVKTRHFPTNIPWEFPGISARNWSKAWQVPKSNLATSQDTTFLVIWDVVVSWSRQSERWGDLDGMDLRDFVGDCWWLLVEFLFGDCLLQKKIWSCIFVFVRPIVRTMYVFLGEKCHQMTYVSEVWGFCGREHRKNQAVNPLTWADCPTNLAYLQFENIPWTFFPC